MAYRSRPHGRQPMDHSVIARPQNTRRTQQLGQNGPRPQEIVTRTPGEWINRPDVNIILNGLDPSTTTYGLWKDFSKEGEIVFIELYERDGKRDGNGKVRFSPPPKQDFWSRNGRYELNREAGGFDKYQIRVKLDEHRCPNTVLSPVRRGINYKANLKLTSWSLDFGFMEEENLMRSLRKVKPSLDDQDEISFVVDLKKQQIIIRFKYTFIDPHHDDRAYVGDPSVGRRDRINSYMIKVPFGQLKTIKKLDYKDPNIFRLMLSVECPPQFHRKRLDADAGHSPGETRWSEWDTWYRQTDIVYDPHTLPTAKVTLHKEQPEIDIGRWTTYLLTINKDDNDVAEYTSMVQALSDFNIEIVDSDIAVNWQTRTADMWNYIDPPSLDSASDDLMCLEKNDISMSLPFEVRYQLEVCISREHLNEFNITKDFVQNLAKLAHKDPARARIMLEYVADKGKRIYNPMGVFEDTEALSYSPQTEFPHYCAHVRKANITPSNIYFSSPTVETTNRVLRHFGRENRDGRFMRVQFIDELFEGRINSSANEMKNDELFTRVYRTLYNGIQIGDRHFEFLAFGNSQFRENGAYFFCPTAELSCSDIRAWMGDFGHIRVAAKYAARLGQCFSTTRAINGVSKPNIVKIPDVEGGKYCFTDGVGKISSFMAQTIATELGLPGNTPPSAFQFRLGGCKGILVVWPGVGNKEIHIRPSQQKFAATYNGLEIIRCARFSAATLNRQTITILSALGVPDQVFLDMLSHQLKDYQDAMQDADLAVSLLCRFIDDTQMTLNIATMIRNGFMAQQDPFVMSLLHLWRAWSIKLLKEKAKIVVENGAFVFGCVDETATLRGYTKPSVATGEEFPLDELPQIFIQVPDKKDPNKYNVIEGICLVGRNPSLHPGDLRVVQAINVPALHHLRDVVVFPQKGERDVPSMCSGGDLDGDDFFVLWDQKLQPSEWNCEPMDFSAPVVKDRKRAVKITDIMKFFVVYMKNDSLPTIALAHLAQADMLPDSVKDPRCLELAALHSKAVDYVKSGQPAEMPKRLRPRKWPHFMESRYRKKEQIYTSDKILGQLYDRVESVNFIPQWKTKFDYRILRAYKLEDSILKKARQVKSQYDTAMRRLLANQDVNTEFEIWSTFLLSKPRVGSDYKFQEVISHLSDALKDQFRAVCIEKAGGKEFAVLGPFVAAMYKVTKEELDLALQECRTMKTVGGREVPKRKMDPKSMPLISFPWLFEKELGRIATGTDSSATIEELGLLPLGYKGETTKRRHGGGNVDMDDFVQQEDGVIVHRGEELDLFRDIDDDYDLSDYDDAASTKTEHHYTNGLENIAAPGQEAQEAENLIHLSGTGVEDVVAPVKLDGLLNPGVVVSFATPPKAPLPPSPLSMAADDSLGSTSSVVSMGKSRSSSSAGASVRAFTIQNTEVSGNDQHVVGEDKEVEEEEEEIDLPVRESALERLARLTGS